MKSLTQAKAQTQTLFSKRTKGFGTEVGGVCVGWDRCDSREVQLKKIYNLNISPASLWCKYALS